MNWCVSYALGGAGDQYVLVSEERTWLEAQSYCRQHYTDLVSVRSQAENEEVRGRLQGSPAWIGLHRDSWRWADGSDSSFSRWAESQPDNQNHNETCVSMLNGKWDDWSCDNKFNFLCQSKITHCRHMVLCSFSVSSNAPITA